VATSLVPRDQLQIPLTDTRNKALITLECIYGGYNPLTTSPAAALSTGTLVTVGTLQTLSLHTKRGYSERRALNAATFGQILEGMPGLVDYDGCKLNNIITYGADFLQACGYAGGFTDDYQAYPQLFFLTLPTPDASVYPVITLMLEKCWFLSNPYEFDVTRKDDLRMTQDVDLGITRITPVQGS
jgi:hypothetical protein